MVLFTILILIAISFIFYVQRKKLIQRLDEQVKLESEANQFQLAQKLAHDIRSPISTLNLISSKIPNEDLRELQKNVVFQINKIADELLDQSKKIENEKKSASPEQLIILLRNLQREYQVKSKAINSQIRFEIEENIHFETNYPKSFVEGLYPILNNFIQNSIEACDENGLIVVALKQLNSHSVELYVEDNGKGIAPEFLKILGTKKATYGKDKSEKAFGNGIAIFNAQRFLGGFNKKLLIESNVNKGTKISIHL